MTTVYGLFRQHHCPGGRGGSEDVLVVLYKSKEEAQKHSCVQRAFCYGPVPVTVWDSSAEFKDDEESRRVDNAIEDAERKYAQALLDQEEAAAELQRLRQSQERLRRK